MLPPDMRKMTTIMLTPSFLQANDFQMATS
jgi:hypothetical protein